MSHGLLNELDWETVRQINTAALCTNILTESNSNTMLEKEMEQIFPKAHDIKENHLENILILANFLTNGSSRKLWPKEVEHIVKWEEMRS